MKELQDGITRLLPDVVKADIEPESCPTWLRRPGQIECAGMWETVAAIYGALTGLVLPEQAPSRERRSLDVLLTYENGQQQILEVDEKQHFYRGPRSDAGVLSDRRDARLRRFSMVGPLASSDRA
ncbi:hypothetical protein SFUMM280S_10662 [Streptomyces fumanus]|uniref:Uncharacterized protein n=1 Tax=Streptomyces fumanus TaxID=67302 RepID=A0A919ADJ5_9ACTN|nr:hypothetical protein GCM10018772_24710 [Streptomyces fumanus]